MDGLTEITSGGSTKSTELLEALKKTTDTELMGELKALREEIACALLIFTRIPWGLRCLIEDGRTRIFLNEPELRNEIQQLSAAVDHFLLKTLTQNADGTYQIHRTRFGSLRNKKGQLRRLQGLYRDLLPNVFKHIVLTDLALVASNGEIAIDKNRHIFTEVCTPHDPTQGAGPDIYDTKASSSRRWAYQSVMRQILLKFCGDAKYVPRSPYIEGVTLLTSPPNDRPGPAIPFSGDSFSDVFLAQHKRSFLVLKRFRLNQMEHLDKAHELLALQTVLLRRLRHTNVLPFLGLNTDCRKIGIVSHWMKPELNDLRYCMQTFKHENRPIPALQWIHEIACGLRYLHDEHVLHGDLRPMNILIDKELHVHITGFGLTFLACDQDGVECTVWGVSRWRAPETFGFDEPIASYAADIWSFGCVCLQISTGKEPFKNMRTDQHVIYALIVLKSTPGSMPVSVAGSEEIPRLIQECCNYQPQLRPDGPRLQDTIAKIVEMSISKKRERLSSLY